MEIEVDARIMINKLTDSQIKGVETTDRDICVVAGPGSGRHMYLWNDLRTL